MIALLFAFLMGSPSFAYIPEYSLIASHAADQHGHGAFQINQLVVFRNDTGSYAVHESWIVEDEHHMRVTLEGRGPLKGQIEGTVLYLGRQKYFRAAQVMRQNLGEDWLAPLLQFRSDKYFRERLVQLKVTPPESLYNRPPLNSDDKPIKYETQGFIRLSRAGGAVCYAIGRPPSMGSEPTVWMAQDQFVLRKYVAANGVILKANNYAEYTPHFWYPRQIIYQFNNNTVEIQTLQVRYLGKLKRNDKRFELVALKSPSVELKLPDVNGLKDFYQRFR